MTPLSNVIYTLQTNPLLNLVSCRKELSYVLDEIIKKWHVCFIALQSMLSILLFKNPRQKCRVNVSLLIRHLKDWRFGEEENTSLREQVPKSECSEYEIMVTTFFCRSASEV